MKLGRIRSGYDSRDKSASTYLVGKEPTSPPLARDWLVDPNGQPVALDSFGNLQFNDCTCAALGHAEQAAAAQSGRTITINTDFVLDAYATISDWKRGTHENDNGASCRDALAYFKKKGIIEAYVRIGAFNRFHVMFAINAGGCAYVGADLPIAAQSQSIWITPTAQELMRKPEIYRARSWGGHAMSALGYDRSHVYFATWGARKRATWEWFFTYVDEIWMPISDLWTTPGELTASGFDLDRLYRDVGKI